MTGPGRGATTAPRRALRAPTASAKAGLDGGGVTGSGFDVDTVGRNVGPRRLMQGLAEGDIRHGLSDGTWSLIDLLAEAALVAGQDAALTLAVWTASGSHGGRLEAFVSRGLVKRVKLVVDRSFVTRQPEACATLRASFGDNAIRVWSSHAKFALFRGGRCDLLLMFSANLNQNKRIENYTIFAVPSMCAEYAQLVADLWERQGEGCAFADSTLARRSTAALLGPQLPEPLPASKPAPSAMDSLKLTLP